jgi:hypothetical protein
MQTEYKNKELKSDDVSTKAEKPVEAKEVKQEKEKEFYFPNDNITIKGLNMEDALKKLEDYRKEINK